MERQVQLPPHVIDTRFIQMTLPIPQKIAINGSVGLQDLIPLGIGTFTIAINYLLHLSLSQVRQHLH